MVLVTSNGWHTGIALARADVPIGEIPEAADFPDAAFLEFGWGDAEFYPAPRPSFELALRASLPGPAVVHLIGLPDQPARVFPAAEVVGVGLTEAGMGRLVAYLAGSFERGPGGRAGPAAPGLHGFSRFYPATGRFHLFNTCNTWTARALVAAGLPLQAEGVQTADELMTRLRAVLARPR